MILSRQHFSLSQAVVSMSLVVVLAAVNWYLQPDRALRWIVVMLAMPLVTWFSFRNRRRRARDSSWQAHSSDITSGVVVGSAVLVISLIINLVRALEWVDPARATQFGGILISLLLIVFANGIPKAVGPLCQRRLSTNAVQSFQRFMGWTLVLVGMGMLFSWLLLPVLQARSVVMILCLFAVLALALRWWMILRADRARNTNDSDGGAGSA